MAREGTAIGQFRLERLLGHGGMGTVYTAVDEMTGREVAVKLLVVASRRCRLTAGKTSRNRLRPPPGPANLAPAEFTRAVMMVPLEDDDTDEVEVILRFDSRRLVVANAETRVPLRTIGYGSVSGAGFSEVPSRLKAFGRGPAHWLDLTVGGEHVVLRLDKRNSTEIISTLEARTGLNVQRVTRR